MSMKKIIIFVLAFVFIINSLICSSAVYTVDEELEAKIAYMVSADDREFVIFDNCSQVKCDIGELVKIVTAIIVLENCRDLSQKVTASTSAIRSIENLGVTTAGILVGETISVEELLYCLLVYNANDASNVLAEFISGSVAEFVVLMNEFADRLGLENTEFSNPGGYLHTNQFSTAREIAVIFKYCMQNPVFEKISSTFLYEMNPTNKYKETRWLKNTNYLINSGIPDYFVKAVKAGKSGYTQSGTANCVSMASQDGYSYICVVLDAPMNDCDNDTVIENLSFVESKTLYDWAFKNIKLRVVANTTTYVGEVKVNLSSEFDYVSLIPAENVSALVPSGVNAQSVLVEPISELTLEKVDAPVKKGDKLGRAEIKYAGVTIAEVDLVAAFDVSLSPAKYVGDKIFKIIKSPVFIIIVLVILLAIIPLAIISYRNKQLKRIKKLKEKQNERRG